MVTTSIIEDLIPSESETESYHTDATDEEESTQGSETRYFLPERTGDGEEDLESHGSIETDQGDAESDDIDDEDDVGEDDDDDEGEDSEDDEVESGDGDVEEDGGYDEEEDGEDYETTDGENDDGCWNEEIESIQGNVTVELDQDSEPGQEDDSEPGQVDDSEPVQNEIMSAQARTSQNFFPPEIDSDTGEPAVLRRSARNIRTREKEQNRMSYM